MSCFDTHVHFRAADGPTGFAALVDRALAAGVSRMVAVGGDPELDRHAVEAATRFPERVCLALGYDRDRAGQLAASDESCQHAIARLRNTILEQAHRGIPVVAVGETGLDYHYSPETAPEQRALLRAQLALCRELALPVIVHSREADADTVSALREHRDRWCHDPERIGVLHCFTGGPGFAEALLPTGLYISFSGIATFRNADSIRAAVKLVPANRLLVETDTPYLAPVPHRGKPNEPAYLPHVIETLAAVRGESVESIASLTTANARRLFGVQDTETG